MVAAKIAAVARASMASGATETAAAHRNTDAATSGSNVRETFTLMSSLIYPHIPVRYLELCALILQRRHMDTVFEERAVQSLCAFPACGNALSGKSGKFRISLARREIYDAQYENKFCSPHCLQKARVFLATLVAKPPQLVPSLVDVFGTESPNPLDFADARSVEASASHQQLSPSRAAPKAPQATTVWAKTTDLGIVERRAATVGAARSDLRTSSSTFESASAAAAAASLPLALTEREAPAAPDATFPDATHAVLIEGFVFPAHKQKLAKKVERLLQQPDDNDDSDANVVVSDSDDSGDSDAASDASDASFVLSDFDDDEVVTLDALSLFANLWRLLATWITHDTHVVVATGDAPVRDEHESTTPVANDPEARAARHRMLERREAFALMLTRPLALTAQRVHLAADRSIRQRIAAISQTFGLRDAIDARNSHQWTCLAALMLLVAHDKRPSDVLAGHLDHVATYTKLERTELAQLLALFYDLRSDDDVVVDTDTQPLEEISTVGALEMRNVTTQRDQPKTCRKCRRASAKCVCAAREAAGGADQNHSDFSVNDVEAMLQEALALRDEYEELLDA